MEGRIEQTDRDWEAIHGFEDLQEVLLLNWQEPDSARRGCHRPRRRSSTSFSRRPSPKNMCSVLQRPTPWAPSSRARRASDGVSAFAERASCRPGPPTEGPVVDRSERSADERHVIAAQDTVAAVDGGEIAAAEHDLSRNRISPSAGRISSSACARTAGTPMPRAISAAWEALPPSLVRIPRAAWNPATSSASVNGRAKMTSRPSEAAAMASPTENTRVPFAAPVTRRHPAPAPRTLPRDR